MLTQAQIDHFHATGFLQIRGLFSGDEITALQAAAAVVEAEGLENRGENHLYRTQSDGSRTYFRSEKCGPVTEHSGQRRYILDCSPRCPSNRSCIPTVE